MTDTGIYATASRGGSSRYLYAEACLRQGMSYQAAARAAEVNELDLRSHFSGFKTAQREPIPDLTAQPTPVSTVARLLRTATSEECGQIAALAIATIDERSGLNVARFTVANIIASFPSMIPDEVTPRSRIVARDVVEYVAAMHGRTFADMCSQRRTVAYSRPRQIAMHCVKALCPHMSYPAIGRLLGGRDHTTAMHGDRRIADLVQRNPDIADAVAKVFERFAGEAA